MRRALRHLEAADPALAGVIRQIGPYRMQYREPDFSTLVRSIVYQQLSGKAAATIYGRLESALEAKGGVTPESLARVTTPRLRSFGLSGQKAAYVKDLALRTRSGALSFEALPALSDDGVIEALTAVKGVGVWTAQMFLIFALRRPDVLPVADLGIQTAVQRVYQLSERPGPKQVAEIGARWRPWASVASWYLWRSLDNQAGI